MTTGFVAAIDQGTSSSRCLIFDHRGNVASVAQKEYGVAYPRPGWVEHDAQEIWVNTAEVVSRALGEAGLQPSDLVALGIANQRETTVVWDRDTGRPVHNAISWQDTRTDTTVRELEAAAGGQRFFRERTGTPASTYFAGPKLRWLLDNVPGLRRRARDGEVLFGTIDSWLVWQLTGRHLTDVTNASRTLMLNLHTLDWDDELLELLGVPRAVLPEICSSAEVYGTARGFLQGVPVAAALGDQQAALFGQACFAPGDTKCTYGTGSFVLMNMGEQVSLSDSGLLTTLACRVGSEPPTYALEGSIAISGALVKWFRDNLGLIGSAPEIETLARTVTDNGGCYFVPAFSGLFTPHWDSSARGVIAGLTGYINKGHLARAVLEATVWQTREVLDAMAGDSGLQLSALNVDGGMTANNLLMQMVADALDVSVVRPITAETVSLGAAYAAGLAVGWWPDRAAVADNWHVAAQWRPQADPRDTARRYRKWRKAVRLATEWLDGDDDEE